MSWQRERERYFGTEERKLNPRLVAIGAVIVLAVGLGLLAVVLPWQSTPADVPTIGPSLPVP